MLKTYEKRTRAGNLINPGKVLYRAWYDALEAVWPYTNWNQSWAMYYGPERYYGIGVNEIDDKSRPIISFGAVWQSYGSSTNSVGLDFQINADGEFSVYHKHGWKQRDILTRMTFLRWSYEFSEFAWFYSPNAVSGGYNNYSLNDLHNRVSYVSERVLRVKGYYHKPWLKLVPSAEAGDMGWKIAFSQDRPIRHSSPPDSEVTQEQFDAYDALREARYRRLLRREQIDQGLIPHRVRKPVDHAAEAARRDRVHDLIVANMVLSQPAKTVPLRKTSEEEEQHGNILDAAHSA